MRYYSDVTKKLYDTSAALAEAERKVLLAEAEKEKAEKEKAEKAKKEERAKRAKEVEDALKVANEAQSKAIKLLKDFTKDYGYFHTSYTTSDVETKPKVDFFDILESFLK